MPRRVGNARLAGVGNDRQADSRWRTRRERKRKGSKKESDKARKRKEK